VKLNNFLAALEPRSVLLDDGHESALRLFNGFYESDPELVVDVYGRTLVIFNYAEQPAEGEAKIQEVCDTYLVQLPWIQTIVLKTRAGRTLEDRRGKLIYGDRPDRRVREGKVWYAIDLLMSQDASLYLDTRQLREWAYRNLGGGSVLNTFAYTGSLGVAARAGGATQVVHLDFQRKYLNIAKDSYSLNGLPIRKSDFLAGDFWTYTSRMRRKGERFDCVFLDPPFFSQTSKGRLDLNLDTPRLINKLRPLVNPGGTLVAINNALYVSGAEYIQALEQLGADGYLEITELIPVPEDITGYPQTIRRPAPASPAPFNHSTKIALLTIR